LENIQPTGLPRSIGSTYFVAEDPSLAQWAPQVRDRTDVLGAACAWMRKGLGYYGYVFYDRIQNGCLKSGHSRLLFWAMYLRMKSAICCLRLEPLIRFQRDHVRAMGLVGELRTIF